MAADAARIWPDAPERIPGIDLRLDEQIATLHQLGALLADLPDYGPAPIEGQRFRTQNNMYGLADAATLHAFVRQLRPRRVIEVGSGFSSAVLLDTVDAMPDLSVEITFIEPYPDRLHSVLRPGDTDRCEVLAQRVQDVDLARFEALEAGDILIIDSSHVSKTGSDVNVLYLEVLPRLQQGVLVHLHDIGYPFEYPRSWVDEGRSWNEAYLLRAFLAFNDRYRIELWNGCLRAIRPEAFDGIPTMRGGSQIWIRQPVIPASVSPTSPG